MNELPPMTLLDYKVSTRENIMLKAFLPYVDKDFQPLLATYIKYSELLSTIELFGSSVDVFGICNQPPDLSDILTAMMPYVSPSERETFENMTNIINAMNMFESYKDIFNTDIFNSEIFNSDSSEVPDEPNTPASDASVTSDIFDYNDTSNMLSSMLSPEQQLMFEHLSDMINR